MINAEVTKSGNENNVNLIRRFTRKVQGSGVLNRIRGRRYSQRTQSEYVKKKHTLKSLARKAEIAQLIKMGKMTEYVPGNKK